MHKMLYVPSVQDSPEEKIVLFGHWIRQHRENARLARSEVARAVGIDRHQLYRIETGASGTKPATAAALARAVGANVDEALVRAAGIDLPVDTFMVKKPNNLAELIRALEQLGVTNIHFADEDRMATAAPEELQEMLESIEFVVRHQREKMEKESNKGNPGNNRLHFSNESSKNTRAN